MRANRQKIGDLIPTLGQLIDQLQRTLSLASSQHTRAARRSMAPVSSTKVSAQVTTARSSLSHCRASELPSSLTTSGTNAEASQYLTPGLLVPPARLRSDQHLQIGNGSSRNRARPPLPGRSTPARNSRVLFDANRS